MSQGNPLTRSQIMSKDNLSATSMLNNKPNSVCYLEGTCQTAWSLAQQFAIVRLSPSSPPRPLSSGSQPKPKQPAQPLKIKTMVTIPPKLLPIPPQWLSLSSKIKTIPISPIWYPPTEGSIDEKIQRTSIVAATYARFYLETEEFGNPKRKGRYYWMALGAFASKTVACSLKNNALRAANAVGIDAVVNGLGKGNFWLFQDIAPIHWLHSYDDSAYFHCANTRGEKLYEVMESKLKQLPWAKQALPILQNLKLSSYAQEGMRLVRVLENMGPDSKEYRKKQLEHLLAIADHEQRVVLQKLIYNDPGFAVWLQRQRAAQNAADMLLKPSTTWLPLNVNATSRALALLVKTILPPLELVFAAACETKDPKLKSVAPKDTVLENEESRMSWIKTAANQFHGLMGTRSAYMDQQLRSIADGHKPTMTTFELVLRQHDPWCML